ncbi:MAG: VTT domain-containing protein [Candidatus Nanoarchaeia archaeon]|nr:VTT domain-containing protein [Candidatus Haiyanarchaeum thermophilum]MCW1303324.1 VTT domain-containing protein [Candidatus Haiyanarchaeum thermophilum]MCW1304094.1 VTT domain-containing protein [Candidatus Haiyanarchaeum thermophilum]MCW1306483.1 VTT domain-containing protein [Candidatus Haiyanarchaeum thermophilum]MCW1307220.1 VTT domain-containing protein [Candidatus Haiyanarchaeum thermophilum]
MIAELFSTLVENLGYVGMFLISFLGASSILLPIPYTVFILLFSVKLDPILLALASGTGAGIGELTGYYLGKLGRRMMSEERLRKMEKLRHALRRYPLLFIFLFSLTPLPDDLIFIPLGMINYPIIPILAVSILGKILMGLTIAYFGRSYFALLKVAEDPTFTIASFVALLLIIYFMLKIDWVKVLEGKL